MSLAHGHLFNRLQAVGPWDSLCCMGCDLSTLYLAALHSPWRVSWWRFLILGLLYDSKTRILPPMRYQRHPHRAHADPI
ncbi:hypothetical protein BC938DRAFT_473705 [Jimgerdemannia flammicorona]|uniref:Uncharacterized protein n=1 Tax=Jimgerdemannia flammicorona TaxID=994334 RepID=A0A433Q3I9_9FUNG|nr:hypothetical protein BC938DRAFT_473705 [Jimgerdemannia flammicorona]